MRVFALGVVGLQMRFPVVAPLEQFAADVAFVRGFLGCRPLTLLLDARAVGQHGRHVKSRQAAVGTGVKLGDEAGGVGLGPVRAWGGTVQVVGL